MNKVVTTLTAGAFAISAIVAPLGAIAQTTTSTSSASTLYVHLLARQLSRGLSGEDVKLLQTLLSADTEVYPEGLVTGYYGPLTFAAVKKFQKKNSLPQVGRVGPLTLGLLRMKMSEHGIGEEEGTSTQNVIRGQGRSILCYRILSGVNVPPGWEKKEREGKQFIKKCGDFVGATSTPPVIPPPATTTDMVAPIISSVSASSTTASTATIVWTTNEFSSSWVWYGTSTPLANVNGTNVTSLAHSVNLVGLSASTTYMYQVVSSDATGNTATSSQQTFMTIN